MAPPGVEMKETVEMDAGNMDGGTHRAAGKPSNLRCEFAVEPKNIESRAPRFSWILPRGGGAQIAYRIRCAATRAGLLESAGGLWDTGMVESDLHHLVPYAGKQLAPWTRVFWAVKTRQAGGEESPWSEVASFETSALSATDWSASWISMPEAAAEFDSTKVLLVEGSINNNRHVDARFYHGMYFRREFRLAAKPSRARAHVCGLGYGELYVNGRRAGDHLLDPGQTDYARRALYSTHDITDLLVEGANALSLVLGNGRYLDAYGYGKPRGFVQIDLEAADGTHSAIVSDDSWKCSQGAIRHNGIYSGETCDMRLDNSGWDLPGYDDSACAAAEIVAGHILVAQAMPPIRATGRLPARSVSSPEPGVYVFDFGQNFAGNVRIRASGPGGTEITLRYSELLDKSGRLNLGTNRESQSVDRFILAGPDAARAGSADGGETYQPRFTYHGFRYVEVRGFPGVPAQDSLEGIVIGTDVRVTGSFLCADPLVNGIHRNILWGQRSNLMSAPTDCPQRGERMGWLGDAQLASEEACCNFDMAGFYLKYLDDIALAQKPDGSLSDVVPPYWPLYPADPAWGAAYVALAWAMYWEYGDAGALSRHYGGMKRYVDYLDACAEGHILKSLGRYGDWCPPGTIYPKKTPAEFTSTWYLYHDTLRFSRIAGILGRTDDERAYAARASAILEAFNAEFLLGDGRYRTLAMSPIDRSVGQSTQALPLFLDMVPADQRERAVHHLLHAVVTNADSHIDAGIVGTRYLFEVLRDCGHAAEAWDIITQTSYPGWGYMIAEGATTVWERWEKLGGQGMNSHNHIMFGTVDAWFFRSLGGIRCTEPGWKRALVAPHAPGTLAHAAATQDTVRGKIAVAWSRSGSLLTGGEGPGEYRLSVSVPAGMKVDLGIPFADRAASLAMDGSTLPAPARVGARFVMELESGDHEFVAVR